MDKSRQVNFTSEFWKNGDTAGINQGKAVTPFTIYSR